MKVGIKAQGHGKHGGRAKMFVQRHGKGGNARRSYNALEKALETTVRQQGKKACRSYHEDY